MSDWPKYESHKIVQAAKIISIGEANDKRVLMVDPGDGLPLEPFQCTQASMNEAAQAGWYAIEYPDGFKSASSAKAFEEGYTRVQQ